MLRASKPIIERVQKQETEKVVRDLDKLGIDWSVGADRGPSKVRVVAKTSSGDKPTRAGDPLSLRVEVTNEGEHPLYQLRATTRSDNPWFEGRELVFGKLAPGQSRSWTTTLGPRAPGLAGGSSTSPSSAVLPVGGGEGAGGAWTLSAVSDSVGGDVR